MKNQIILLLLYFVLPLPAQNVVVQVDLQTIISEDYIGNGAQWDPYQLDYGKGRMTISDADWQKLYDRLDFMRPGFIRVMTNTLSHYEPGTDVPGRNLESLYRILDYCLSRDVTVLFGDWGGSMVDSRSGQIREANLRKAAELVEWLYRQKGYTCIRYYNMVNEPNGDWSATNTSYPLWATAIRFFYGQLQELDLEGSVQLVGPDAAIWDTKEAWWVTNCAKELGEQIGLYDIHTYPSKITVNSGEYSEIIRAYKDNIPPGQQIVMGEIGFKYVEEADSVYRNESISRAEAKPYASVDDSQMFVYDYLYGTDMADALFQTINEGYSGSVVWMLDDAMHSKETPDKLKVWGFWNILGDEYFGEEEEKVRPWYYAWSLLCRYIPSGSTVYKTVVEGDAFVKAVTIRKGDAYTLAVVNVSKESKVISWQCDLLPELANCKQYLYSEGKLRIEKEHLLLPVQTNRNLSLERNESLFLPAESLIVFTNFDY
ncbi:MAG: hypothetical protein LUH15_04825 [Tannerellaceae bacterium]|nr:hypothetical protein [Tannerellaceae bacterium]